MCGRRRERRLVIAWSLDGGGDGRAEDLSVLCLAASQLSRLMEIPSPIAALALCRHAVEALSDFL